MSSTAEKAIALIKQLNAENPLPVIEIKASKAAEPLPVTVSKFGGVPYLPVDVEAPTDSDGNPMAMIAQINCAELPENPIYPPTGMVQFWIGGGDDWGLGGENDRRVIYYPQLGEANPEATATMNDDEHDICLPVEHECALEFVVLEQEIFSPCKDSVNHPLIEKWNQAYPEQTIKSLFDLDDFEDGDVLEEIEKFTGSRDYSKIGGLPDFVQGDPRYYHENAEEHGCTVNLLTMDSVWDGEEYLVIWGDNGTANWLIAPDRLAARDFSQVFYEWSCG